MRELRTLLIALVAFVALASGCSSNRPLSSTPPEPQQLDLSNPNWVKEILYAQYDEWRSVKYKSGGLSKSGVDCSGFVYLTYDSRFDIQLPRSTTEQVTVGTEIPQNQLAPGDLVFFKTGAKQRHVGIYIEGRKFVHASTERGVMISSLDDEYWSRRYWKSVHINLHNNTLSAR
ncbi:MAG TPA: NlpC/P60 family protein [Spongiibacteraceae bacterium]|nr:NlpC/P60 family protein [Spongiibacteraceae bacterium]